MTYARAKYLNLDCNHQVLPLDHHFYLLSAYLGTCVLVLCFIHVQITLLKQIDPREIDFAQDRIKVCEKNEHPFSLTSSLTSQNK